MSFAGSILLNRDMAGELKRYIKAWPFRAIEGMIEFIGNAQSIVLQSDSRKKEATMKIEYRKEILSVLSACRS